MSLMISVWISSAIKFIKKCKILMEGLLNTFLTSIFCYINLSRPQNKDSMVPRYIYLECCYRLHGRAYSQFGENLSGQTITSSLLYSSQPSKPVSRFKMQRK
ncbi:Uncharacterized protein TCM_008138 [Theobroma cacao]|uniref:Uncharacterized protein n=1 Tax=Theobroma cacao TaxID=3641 RepID=A0A061E333_THECC|nr:Uncharacterized protein TCM_008138 [Theobroma cacao]